MLLNNIYIYKLNNDLHSLFNLIFANQRKPSLRVETSIKTIFIYSVNKFPTKPSCRGVTFGCIFKLLTYFKREMSNLLWEIFVVCFIQIISIHINFCVNAFYTKQYSAKYIVFL